MKVLTLTNQDLSRTCEKLVQQLDYKPDLIVGVLNGGGYIVEEIKKSPKFKEVNYTAAKFQRNNQIKNNITAKFLLKKLPYKILNKIRIIESNLARKSISIIDKEDLLNIELPIKSYNNTLNIKKILVVDDAIDTGKTMFVFKNNLKKFYPEADIKIAVVSWTIEESIMKPDYYVHKNVLVRFPWAKDYKGKYFEKKCFSS